MAGMELELHKARTELEYLRRAIDLHRSTLASYEQIFHIMISVQEKYRREMETMAAKRG